MSDPIVAPTPVPAAATAAVAGPAPVDTPTLSTTSSPHDTPGSTTPIPPSAEAGPSTLRVSVIDKWLKPNGPPRGVSFGARKLQEQDDVWSNNAW